MIEIAPSILAADPLNMGTQVKMALDAGCDALHIDIMDAHFVPNLSYGPDIVRALRGAFPKALLDVHLMMTEPERYIEACAKAGADEITVHVEISCDKPAIIKAIRASGAKPGLSLKPATPAEALFPYLPELHQILVMSVEPGYGGQSMMPETLDKLAAFRRAGFRGVLSVDGGIKPDNALLAVQKGASRLVMGTAFFKSDDPSKVIKQCRSLAK